LDKQAGIQLVLTSVCGTKLTNPWCGDLLLKFLEESRVLGITRAKEAFKKGRDFEILL